MGTIEFVDGFDDYTNTQAVEHGWSANWQSMYGGRISGQCAQIAQTTTQRAVAPDAHYTIAFAILAPSSGSGNNGTLTFKEGSTTHGTFNFNQGQMSFTGATFTGWQKAGYGSSVWYHVEIDFLVGNSPNGSYSVKVNGVTEKSESGLDTQNGGSGVINYIGLTNAANQYMWFDDMVFVKGGGAIGDCRVITQYPLLDGTNSDWTPVGNNAIAYQTEGTAFYSTGGGAVAWPSHQIYDIGILVVETQGNEPISLTSPAGFVECANSPVFTGSGAGSTRISVYWCRATSSSMGSVTISDSGDHNFAQIYTFRGCIRNGTPYSTTAAGTKDVASESVTVTGLTTTFDGSIVAMVVSQGIDSASPAFSGWANANLTDLTERVDIANAANAGGGWALVTGTKTTAGATGNTTATVASSVNAFLSIALIPSDAHAGAVNEANPISHDSDTSYITANTVGNRDTFTFPALGVSGTVKAVAIGHVSRKDDAGLRQIATSVRSGGSNHDGTPVPLSVTYQSLQEIWETDPNGDIAWTVANVDAAEYGVEVDS